MRKSLANYLVHAVHNETSCWIQGEIQRRSQVVYLIIIKTWSE
jgi:hypothetical protein